MTLRSIFYVFKGIGPERDSALRASGAKDWLDILDSGDQLALFDPPLHQEVREADRRYAAGDVAYFYQRLPRKLAYILCLEFPELVTYVDIEATGLSRTYHTITLVGWSSGREYRYELLGRNRAPGIDFLSTLESAPIVVTFNGSLYDLPFLRSKVELPPLCHVDLRYLAFRLGLTGSQKVVEKTLEIRRPAAYAPVRGEDAPALWYRATRGEMGALRRLLEYNYLDIRGMAKILKLLAPQAAIADGLDESTWKVTRARAAKLPIPRKRRLTPDSAKAQLAGIAGTANPLLRFRAQPHGRPITVVGIDLTGSEERPSGVAAITGNEVSLVTAHTDDSLLRFVSEHNADLVSIDAPLSLPAGRTRVTDDDPTRATAGIMRWSERELKRRGVNVYPCLLPSMQRLTERGMRLADTLRARGVPTIESYPGAAQDILSMPRKGVGVDFLRQSLEATCLTLPDRPCNHDELDAVTSAVVGVLFLSGRYEALGTEDEDPMVVPQLEQVEECLPRAVVALSGGIGAGKTTAGRWLEQDGWTYGRYSQVIARQARARGLEPERVTLQSLGEVLHKNPGQRWLGRQLLRLIGSADRIVIDGIRFRSDVAFLRETFGRRLFHIHISADSNYRRSRYIKEGHPGEDFDQASAHPVEGESVSLVALADTNIINESSRQDLFDRLTNAVNDAFPVKDHGWVEVLR